MSAIIISRRGSVSNPGTVLESPVLYPSVLWEVRAADEGMQAKVNNVERNLIEKLVTLD